MAWDLSDAEPGVVIRSLGDADPPIIATAFDAIGWNKPEALYTNYLAQQRSGAREVFVAEVGGVFAGYVTLLWETTYGPFAVQGIPEVNDFNVLPHLRRQGIGSALMDRVEEVAASRVDVVGIGVGMTEDYGAAQRMYVKRGYVPDGRGLMTHERAVAYGEEVRVDDDLALYFTKRLR